MDIHGTSGPSRDSTSHVPISAASLNQRKTKKQEQANFRTSKLTCRQQGNNLCMGSKEGLKVVGELSGKNSLELCLPRRYFMLWCANIFLFTQPNTTMSQQSLRITPKVSLQLKSTWAQTQLKWIMQLAYLKHLTLTHPVGAIHTLYKVYMSYITSFSPLITQYTFS